MRILYVTTIGLTMCFFQEVIKELIDQGHTVDIACNETDVKVPKCYLEWGCYVYQINCNRSPLSLGNLNAIKEIRNIILKNDYDVVHCHTPIAGVCTRMACRKLRKRGLNVIYTAHGFHFYKGAPLINWLIYFPIEYVCSYFTDILITINQEDYELSKKKLKAKKIEYIPGVGIDINKFKNSVVNRELKRKKLGIPLNAFLLFSVGELNNNKNHQIVIRAIAKLNTPKIHYMIAGKGTLLEPLLNLAKKLGVSEQVHLLGYRSDVTELYKVSDLYIHPSKREGLPVSLMEALASGTSCVASNIRGCSDLLNEGLFNPNDVDDLIKKIKTHHRIGYINEMYSVENIKNKLRGIYQ